MSDSESKLSAASPLVKAEMLSPDSTTSTTTDATANTPATTPTGRPKRKYRSRARQRSPEAVQRSKRLRRGKANDRERRRMHSLNSALERLRFALPAMPDDSKMTKIETLRMAHNYILALSEMLKMSEEDMSALDNQQHSASFHLSRSSPTPSSSFSCSEQSPSLMYGSPTDQDSQHTPWACKQLGGVDSLTDAQTSFATHDYYMC
uniref:BHLH domain-containing protein n=1 Tax=Plectus sambesii TaxID=2011161 RepID=A0A914W6C6_9BILA